MAAPVNLNRLRKARARAEKQARAEQNVVKYGRSKTEKTQEAARRDKSARDLDGARRQDR